MKAKRKFSLLAGLCGILLGAGILFRGCEEAKDNNAREVEKIEFPAQKIETEKTTVTLPGGVPLVMVKITSGTFQRRSNHVALSSLSGRIELRDYMQAMPPVEMSEFWIGQYEVTQEQYEAVIGKNPSIYKTAKNPVETVSWDDAKEFCEELTTQTGISFTLPTDAQWEYACRAGSRTVYCFGNNESGLSDYAWYVNNSGKGSHPVGQKMPNAWDLYDMHGNVWEWCRDYYDVRFYGTSSSQKKNPENTKSTEYRVLRGGSWRSSSVHCRSDYKNHLNPALRNRFSGFRIVRTQD